MPDKHLTRNQIGDFLSATKTSRNPERNYSISVLIWRHRFRVSQLCSIKLWDINLESGEFYLKGRISVLHPLCQEAIESWLPERDRMNVPRAVNTLFVSERRKPLDPETVWLFITLAAETAGLGYLAIHPEDLRHWSLD
jgi:site-specific recombinase XerD